MPALDELFNLAEAGLWFVFAGIFAALALRAQGPLRRLCGGLAPAFLAFGLSDLVEARSGAWWRPWWLLVLKGACICAFLYAAWAYRRIRRGEGRETDG
jgi:hypothetical protein